MEYTTNNVYLTNNQKIKIKSSFRQNKSVIIQLKFDKLKSGNNKIFLRNGQYNKLEKH